MFHCSIDKHYFFISIVKVKEENFNWCRCSVLSWNHPIKTFHSEKTIVHVKLQCIIANAKPNVKFMNILINARALSFYLYGMFLHWTYHQIIVFLEMKITMLKLHRRLACRTLATSWHFCWTSKNFPFPCSSFLSQNKWFGWCIVGLSWPLFHETSYHTFYITSSFTISPEHDITGHIFTWTNLMFVL